MLSVIESVNAAINNFIWGVPAMICIIGVGLYLSIRTNFLQIRKFPYAIKVTIGRMLRKREASDGSLTPFQAVCTALAATVGTGNIAGVAGAIAIGGPGAVFWMWVSAFFGMATAFTEGTLAQIFKEKRGDTFVGGLPFYARKLCGNKVWVGTILSLVYIVYALMCLPAQGFNVVTSAGAIAGLARHIQIPVQSTFYYVVSEVVILLMAFKDFGGIRRVYS